MRRIFIAGFAVLLALMFQSMGAANVSGSQENQNTGQVLSGPYMHRHARMDVRRRRHRGIGGSFAEAGRSAGRGGRRFGREMGRGRPVRAGKYLGKGMGGFGKHTGRGVGKTGKRVGHVTKRALTP